MARRAVTEAQKREAVALARMVGADLAAQQLGWDTRSVRRWMVASTDPMPDGDWGHIADVARARVHAMFAAGKVSVTQAAVVAGIATDKIAKARAAQPPAPERTDVERFVDDLEAWAVEHRPDLTQHHPTGPGLADAVLIAILQRGQVREWAEIIAGRPVENEEPASMEDEVAWLSALDLEAWRTEYREREAEYGEWVASATAARRAELAERALPDWAAAIVAEAERYLETTP